MYSKEEIERIEKEIEDAIYLNNYKRVDTELINSIDNIELEKETTELNDEILEIYFSYLKNLSFIPSDVSKAYLELIKDADIIDNQSLEMEDSFLVAIYSKLQNKHAIDELLQSKEISKELLIKAHDTLIKDATSSHRKVRGFRTANTSVVGSIVNGKRQIKYFPIDHKQIDFVAEQIVKYANNKRDESYYKIFIKSIVVHGLIAAYQMFDDGNTRLARSIQHCKINQMTNEYTQYKSNLPVLYASRQYYPFREDYRNLITDLVMKSNSEAWNNWINFNLRRIEDSLYFNIDRVEDLYDDQLKKYKRLIKNIEKDMTKIKS